MKAMQFVSGFAILLCIGLAIANPRKPAEPAQTGWATVKPDLPAEKPQGIIGDSKALVSEVRATLKAFNDGGLSVTLAKPPKSSDVRLIPTEVAPPPTADRPPPTAPARRGLPILRRICRRCG